MKEEKNAGLAGLTYGLTVVGMVLGCLFYLGDLLFCNAGYFRHGLEEYSIGAVMNLPVEQIAVYVLKQRGGQILLFVLGMILTSCRIITGIYSVFFGGFYGITMCSFLVQYGIKGMGYGLACFFPHYLCYILAIYFLGKWSCEKQSGLYKYHPNVNFLQSFIKFIVIFLLILVSLIWEIRFQKNILNFLYQYLVG